MALKGVKSIFLKTLEISLNSSFIEKCLLKPGAIYRS